MTQAAQLAQYGSNNVGLSFKNRIINGDMTINQRSSTVTINSGSGRLYSVDRWAGETNSSGAFTIAQSSTAPAGFTNSTVATVTSTVSAAGNTFAFLEQQIEGFNTADFQFGTANAQAFTVSFWARSSVAGTYSAVLGAGSYSYVFNYTLTANTWTFVTQTMPALTVGSGYNTTNGVGLKIRVSLYTNGTLGGATGSWINADYTGSTTQTNLLATNGATFNLTGVQIEKGSVATSFDYLPYGTELMLCQRYYWAYIADVAYARFASGFIGATTSARFVYSFPVDMRTSPTGSAAGSFAVYHGADAVTAVTGINIGDLGSSSAAIAADVASGLTVGGGALLIANNSASARFNFSAEL